MALGTITCPNCGTPNEAEREEITVHCGMMSCSCTCTNCGSEFDAEEEYWRWLGLEEGPHNEPGRARA